MNPDNLTPEQRERLIERAKEASERAKRTYREEYLKKGKTEGTFE